MRVLVTGSSGKIGREQARTLLNEGHEVKGFDRAASSELEMEQIVGDLGDIAAMRNAVQGMDAVVHLGAIPHDFAGPVENLLASNVLGTLHVLQASVEMGVARVVAFSSVNALGCVGGHRPGSYLPIDDEYPRHPLSPYQLSKHLGEEACKCYSERYGLSTVSLRPVYVATSADYTRWRDGRASARGEDGKTEYWAYVDIRDVCDAALRSLTVETITNDSFLLTAADTSVDTPSAELVSAFYPDTPWHGDQTTYFVNQPNRSLIDCSHAAHVLGWKPTHSWRE